MKYLILLCIFLQCNSIDVITLNSTNHVSIIDKIDENTSNKFIKDLNYVKDTNIILYIKSPGGSVDSGEQIIQYMRYKQNTNHLFTCIADKAMSMAFHIFQNCNVRLVLATSVLMQHQMSTVTYGNLENIKNYITMLDKVNKYYAVFESSRLNITVDEYKRKVESDWWIYGYENIIEKTADYMIDGVGCSNQLITNSIKYDDNKSILDVNSKFKLCPII